MKVTQGTFSYLPDLTDDEIEAQVDYCLRNDWPVSIEYTDDPHPRNTYWNMFGLPLFDQRDPSAIMSEVYACRKAFPNYYIRLNGYDRSYGRQTTALSFIINRPKYEPGIRLERQNSHDRTQHYSLKPYSSDKPAGERYGSTR